MKRGMIIPCLIRKPAFLCASVLLLIVLTLGCDFIATSHFHTNSPTVEHVQKCRELMYIRPGVKLQPLGYSHQQGLDDSIRMWVEKKWAGKAFLTTFINNAMRR